MRKPQFGSIALSVSTMYFSYFTYPPTYPVRRTSNLRSIFSTHCTPKPARSRPLANCSHTGAIALLPVSELFAWILCGCGRVGTSISAKPRDIIWVTRWAPWMVHAWEDRDDEDVVGDDGDVCAPCCTKSNVGSSMCDKCRLMCCTGCIDVHTCDN